jgi:Flp pilus assembly protein TadD
MVSATQTSSGEDRKVFLDPQDAELLRSLGYVAGATIPESLVQGSAVRSVESPRGHAAAVSDYLEAQRLIGDREYAEAEKRLRSVLADLPDAPEPRADLIAVLRNQNRADEVLPALKGILDAHPEATGVRVQYANWLAGPGGNPRAALDELREASARSPRDAEARFALGSLLASEGLVKEGRSQLESAAILAPEDVRICVALGRLCAETGDLAAAAKALKRAAVLAPDSMRIKEELNSVETRLRTPKP